MASKDEYIIKDDGESYTYIKNGKIHREFGPAIFSYENTNKNEYLNLEDKNLYKFIHVNRFPLLFESEVANIRYSKWQAEKIHYFLDDKEYSKEEFEKIKASRELNNELSTELTTNQSNIKKPKI